MSSQDFDVLLNDVVKKLSNLNNVYVRSRQKVFGYGSESMDVLKLDGNIGNATFKLIAPVASNAQQPVVSVFDNSTSSYGNPITIDTISDNVIANPNISEINCLSLLGYLDTSNTNTANYMSGLYALYAVLNSNYFDDFVNSYNDKTSFKAPLNIPVIDSNSNVVKFVDISQKLSTYLGYVDSKLMWEICSIPNFNAFIARRIVYLWILMYNFSIAYNYYLSDTTNTNSSELVMACLQIIQNNNRNFVYNSPLENAAQESINAQACGLIYQMWCVCVQILIPSAKASLDDLPNGNINIKTGKTCTGINPQTAIDSLNSSFESLSLNYDFITPEIASQIQKKYVDGLSGMINEIKKDTPCNEDSSALSEYIASSMSNAANNVAITKTALDTAELAKNNALAARTSANVASKTAVAAYRNAQSNLAAEQSKLTGYTTQQQSDISRYNNDKTQQSSIPAPVTVVPTLTTTTTLTPSLDYSQKGTAITYSVSLDLTVPTTTTTAAASWDYIFMNSKNSSSSSVSNGLYPALYISNTGDVAFIHNSVVPAGDNSVQTKTKLTPGTTYTITIVVSNNTLQLYINGIFVSSKSAPTNNPLSWSENNIVVNNWKWNTTKYNIKNLKWWKIALTSSQISLDYNYNVNSTLNKGAAVIESNNSNINSQTAKVASAQATFNSANTALQTSNQAFYSAHATYVSSDRIHKKAKIAHTSALNVQSALTKETAKLSPSTSILLTDLQSITSQIYQLTQNYNTASTINTENLYKDPLAALKGSINANIIKYRNNQAKINIVSNDFTKNKKTLAHTKLKLSSRTDQGNKLNMYKYIVLCVLLMLLIYAFVIVLIDFQPSTKAVLTIILTLFVIIETYLLLYVFSGMNYKETFAISRNNNDISVAKLIMMDESIAYLMQTENLNIVLQSQYAYGNMNQALDKELSYYNDASLQLVNSTDTVHSVYKSAFITQIKYTAAIQLFVTLSILIAAFTIIYVCFESFEIVGTPYIWLSCIIGALVTIALIIYMLEVNTRVHTNPKQIYWGQPSHKF